MNGGGDNFIINNNLWQYIDMYWFRFGYSATIIELKQMADNKKIK